MNQFAVITNRRRAVIAVAHSVVFLLIAVWGLVTSSTAAGLSIRGTNGKAGLIMASIYLTVTSVLLLLACIARPAKERLYFGFCASSAGAGLLRAIFGDPSFHAGQYFRVVMLLCAVLTGTVIWRSHRQPGVAE